MMALFQSLADAYASIPKNPRLKPALFMYLAVTTNRVGALPLTAEDIMGIEFIKQNLYTPEVLSSECRKLLQYYTYLCNREGIMQDLHERMQIRINDCMQLKKISTEQLQQTYGFSCALSELSLRQLKTILYDLKL